MNKFKLVAKYKPSGSQPSAIKHIVKGFNNNKRNQVLLGVTGSGKTFTMANIINELQRPALIMAHNKTLAAQLYGEMKDFFPNNHVEYFVSFYDYYQPEVYLPNKNLYIEKDSDINEQIDRLRHSATRALLDDGDVIIIASVSSIYGIGSPETYSDMIIKLDLKEPYDQTVLTKDLSELQYERNNIDFSRGKYRVLGDIVDIFPSHLEHSAIRIVFFGDEIEEISEIDPLTNKTIRTLDSINIYPNSHYVTPHPTIRESIVNIEQELADRIKFFKSHNKLIEAQRIEERTNFDIEMLQLTGFCKGIENYSRYLTGKKAGEPPPTLFDYLPDNILIFVDESHATLPQIRGMYKGDRARKSNLSDYGFRLPSCLDNRPLKFEEWDKFRGQTLFISATPGPWELDSTSGEVIEQIIRPTGLLDPKCEVRKADYQVDDVIAECKKCIKKSQRILITTLTKKMAEQLTEYLEENGLKVRYLHSDIDTIERVEIINDLRRGVFDVLVGINLLREGLDIPECGLVAILDADKEGFLRSRDTLIQTMGRASRNDSGRVILYANKITKSMQEAISVTTSRREMQQKWNEKYNIKPKSIKKDISLSLNDFSKKEKTSSSRFKNKAMLSSLKHKDSMDMGLVAKKISFLKLKMNASAEDLKFERAAQLRDEIKELEKLID